MATKLQNISELARQTTERLTQSVDNWKRFLDSAAWLYKYPFHEQVLIHAQRPDAKACAPIELWNSRFRRWVNRGAKGIALIDDSGHKPALRYVFDVSDTNTRYNIPFRLWQTKSQYTAQIIEELQNHFGDTGVENADIAATVLGISINAVSDNYRDYYEELLKAADNSALADMSDDEISSVLHKSSRKAKHRIYCARTCGIWTSSMSNPGFCLGMASIRRSSSPITEHRQTHRSKACIPSARHLKTSSADMMFPRRAWWRSARELPPYPRRQNRFVGA